ncbi:sodium/calcium exchanger NCL [Malania oleifera]|uniref:sodium/calcium exchanger NCL n=1 Tax=Malania oleifera TaxID=397392 RepID=UPI0025AE333F|nr:sodium/calcium exchanger NCL [Malania oleifera]
MATFKPPTNSSLLLLCLLVAASFRSTGVSGRPYVTDDLISDGVDLGILPSPFIVFPTPPPPAMTSSETCELTYGFMPCTTTVLGNIFLIVVYGYLMYLAATFLSSGSELLLVILGPGIIGGLFLPVLGALPDALLILVSGLSGSKETAQSQVSVGMGLLAGSTVMLLTIIWGSCVIVGKCDIRDSVAVDSQDTKRFSLTGSGITTDIWTSYAARIMAVSVIPFIIVQVPQVFHSTSGRHLAVLIALIVSIVLLISYCLYQLVQPWIQRGRIAFALHKHFISGMLGQLKKQALGRLLRDDGRPNEEVIEKLFGRIDQDSDGKLSESELRAFVFGIQFEEMDLNKDDAVLKVIKEFDADADGRVDKNEFIKGIAKWLNVAKGSRAYGDADPHTQKFIDDFREQTRREHDRFVGYSEETTGSVENPKLTSFKAVMLLLLGTAIAAVFADPLVDAVDNFSDATSIPAFFISFIALPLATNASESVSAIIFACRKTGKNASLTFSEIYGAVTMNNVLCLAVFLALVYIRGLTWDFSAEVLVILIVCIVMGAFASLRTTFPLWTSLVAFFLYPFSLVLVYLLDNVFGWS